MKYPDQIPAGVINQHRAQRRAAYYIQSIQPNFFIIYYYHAFPRIPGKKQQRRSSEYHSPERLNRHTFSVISGCFTSLFAGRFISGLFSTLGAGFSAITARSNSTRAGSYFSSETKFLLFVKKRAGGFAFFKRDQKRWRASQSPRIPDSRICQRRKF